ncbi:hypothetical protein AURDEDRAFT_176688 [Auricularia subglabra TFB-10046 SS5]|uniref:Uncharacterized protein n=1 Tax=Auricularia subglabra (strain TFB-10046 / SS5) TaxID=717982 RepID=J0D5Z6_AURST|nr:hypothetical protein AURDEDRAFT_176688 [Auricularia subglabra TFB-10046 SS5]
MHLVWLNLIPNLTLLYTGKFKGLDEGKEDYVIAENIWDEIGRITAASGATIPSAFGARVPNLAKDRTYMIAETWCIWALFIAPTVLRGRFREERYYTHFMQLIELLRCCLQLEVTQEDIDFIRLGFVDWVLRYEKLHYQYDPARLATCVSTVHGLLHIADSIVAMGTVGGYWWFVMECFCSSLRPAIRSRKHPYTSIDHHVSDMAKIHQVLLAHNLDTSFQQCEADMTSLVRCGEFSALEYPSSALTIPSMVVELTASEHSKIARYLSARFNCHAKAIAPSIPKSLRAWGKVRHLDGGDTMHARGLVTQRRDDRDASFIQYSLMVDKNARSHHRAPEFSTEVFFGQLSRVFICPLPALPQHKQKAQTLLLAEVQECKGLTDPNMHGLRFYDGTLRPTEIVDLVSVECVVGRIQDRGKWSLIDRSNDLARVIIPEDDDDG